MNKETVMAGIERASQLINSPEFNRLVESKAPYGNKKGLNNGGGAKRGGISGELAAFEAQTGLAGTTQSRTQANVLTEGRDLPDFNTIKESMRQQPTPAMNSFSLQQPQQQIIREQVVQQPAPQPTYVPQGIDYNYLKYIINECIKENMATQLNESANLSGIKMLGGNKIQFTTSKGEIYEGTLKLVGRTK